MSSPPGSKEDALELLLECCPEFRMAWEESAQVGTNEDGGVGLHWVFASVICPFLDYALTREGVGPKDEGFDHFERHARYVKNHFATEDFWREVPEQDTPELEDLIDRLYEVLELWAASSSQQIRDAVYIEIAESGMADLTAEDLAKRSGPYLRSLYLDDEDGLRASLFDPED